MKVWITVLFVRDIIINMQKINLFFKENSESILLICIVLFVGISSFFIGKLSVITPKSGHDVLVTHVNNQDAIDLFNHLKEENTSSNAPASIVASKNGTKYYSVWCSGAERIKDSNKVFFDSPLEAEKAGYGKASGCDSL
jgi:hypothetical protein